MYFQGGFTFIDFPGSIANTTFAVEIINRGDIVGEYDLTVEITNDFIYKNGEYRTLDTPFGHQAEARDINDAGVIVGDAYDDPFEGPVHGFSLDNDTFTQFDFPGISFSFATFTVPYAVNNPSMHAGIFIDFNPFSEMNE